MVSLKPLRGAEIVPFIDDISALRIAVFRAFPYLYDGDMAYEQTYLGRFAASANAFVLGAFDGTQMVGAATASPMEEHEEDFSAPLRDIGLPVHSVHYCAESVLLPAYRGRGLGHRFFDAREEEGRRLGRSHSVFCAVTRPPDHPARPTDYSPLDAFWRKRGYAPIPGAVAHFTWRDIGQDTETEKPLQLWSRAL